MECRGLRRVVGDRVVFDKINFDLKLGEVAFVTGPSGIGKSLLLRGLACLDKLEVCSCTPRTSP